MTQPAWLANWQPQPTNHRSGPQVEPKPKPAPNLKAVANPYGFVIPQRWPQDGGTRREPVLDVVFDPPACQACRVEEVHAVREVVLQ